jgi:hypothetical protein
VFSPDGSAPGDTPDTLMSRAEYGCIRPDGGAIVLSEGRLGMMRGAIFHPVTQSGAEFLRMTDNPLARHC